MLTLEDCLGVCDLTREEIDAIAIHEHVPEIVAAALGEYLVHREDGVPCIRRIILDDIAEAKRHGHSAEAERLESVLRHFIATHPQLERHLRSAH